MVDHQQILKHLFASYSPIRLAQDLNITKQAVYQWRKVPPERVLDIERITGIPREELRPDVFGERHARLD